ncbi:acetyl-CoA carboxylase, biotin carboxylase subunit [Batrachochytrium salamandrivorans]|nr:acetyl-CoA carboxylase, biotin carboxylase subunit [Batrachochytrium salamandrivorans]
MLSLSKMRSFSTEKTFDKILIANRGEIACRVMKTAKKMGIKTVAIYSEADAKSQHVLHADEAYCVGPPPSAQSYLNVPRILEVIRETGAQAVHPGYGFLSENRSFAKTLGENGVAFIGPNVHAIQAMGDKIASKELAIKAKVNTVPGSLKVLEDAEECVRVSREIGYPVMIKASAGGGGKGMRVAHNDTEARSGFKMSTDEAIASFADNRVFVEKFVEVPRHVEIQVMGDNHGNVVALPERECSIQRRNQKVLEEAPSPFLDPETRARMQQQAVDLAKAVQYNSAGTVEFLCDKNRNFYFLEMNTRLQVEHPITELITGVDLVEQMIRVAAGHKLPQQWLDTAKPGLPFFGWAHEARVYAEDATRGFLPSIGRLTTYLEPSGDGVRCDTGVVQGSEISMYYDPMICKLCTHAPTRIEALNKLEVALDNYMIQGVGHNIPFLRDVARAERFREGRLTTNYIPEEYPEGFTRVALKADERIKLAAIAAQMDAAREEVSLNGSGVPSEARFVVIEGEAFKVVSNETGVKVQAPNATEAVQVGLEKFEWQVDSDIARAEIDNKQIPVQFHARLPTGYRLQMCGATLDVQVLSTAEKEMSQHMIAKVKADTSKYLLSPMPGVLVSVAVKVGDSVFAGQDLCIVEAMKMQNNLQSPKQAKVKAIHAKAGATLAVDEIIVEFE